MIFWTLMLLLAGADDAPGAAARHFTQGQWLFAQGEYRGALEEFEAANRALPAERAEVDFNIGQCRRNLGDPAGAVAAFERYLELKPDAADRRQVLAIVSHLRRKPQASASASQAPATPPAPPAENRTAEPEPAPEPPKEVAAPSEPLPTVPVPAALPAAAAPAPKPQPAALDLARPEPASSSSEPVYRRWWFWAGVGAAVVMGTVGLYAAAHTGESTGMVLGGPPATQFGEASVFDARGR